MKDNARDLLSAVRPVVQTIARRRLSGECSPDEIDGVVRDVIVKVIEQMQRAQAGAVDAVADVRAYTAAFAHDACDAVLRLRRPEWWRLKNRVHYTVSHMARCRVRFDLERGRICEKTAVNAPEITTALGKLIETILVEARKPVEIDALVDAVAARSAIDVAARNEPADSSAAFATTEEARLYLRDLWNEIRELPIRQRTALVLNPADLGDDLTPLLTETGTASLRDVAAALEMAPEELAGISNELPLEDDAIAIRLGITRQQVINLRTSARDRLARRMRGK